MEQLKAENEFRETVKNSYNLIKRDSEHIPDPSQLNDKNKGDWIEHKPEQFHQLFDGLLDYCADEDCYDNLGLELGQLQTIRPPILRRTLPRLCSRSV